VPERLLRPLAVAEDPEQEPAHGPCHARDMTIKRLDHVGVVVDDLAAAIAFFTALGMTLEREAPVEGPWVDRVNGLDASFDLGGHLRG